MVQSFELAVEVPPVTTFSIPLIGNFIALKFTSKWESQQKKQNSLHRNLKYSEVHPSEEKKKMKVVVFVCGIGAIYLTYT